MAPHGPGDAHPRRRGGGPLRSRGPALSELRLFDEYPEAENILFFDADTIFLQEWNPRVYADRREVVCVRYFPCTWVCVKMLRHIGCTLPIEVWHLGAEEMTAEMRALLAPLGVEFVDGHAVRRRHPVRTLHGWEMKAYALLHSRFAEVLLLDADNVAVRDPADLFDAPEYQQAGAVFWPDFGRLPADHSIWRLTGVTYRDEPEFESGQILVNKERCWHALQVAMHLNEYSDFYYRHIHGDKETFHFAWRKLGQDYAMPACGIDALEATMCQHDFAGERLFQHRNMDKWNPWDGNRRVHGFLHEERCLAFCAELAARWDPTPPTVRRYREEKKSAEERAAAARVVGRRFDYHRVGYDRRPLHLLPDGRVGEGAAGCELFWDLRVADGGKVLLEIYSDRDVTVRLEPNGHDIWRGRWLRHECMPIELTPLADEEVCAPGVLREDAGA
jgi:hypothetical protein